MAFWIALGVMFVVVLVALFRGENIRPMNLNSNTDLRDWGNCTTNPASPRYIEK